MPRISGLNEKTSPIGADSLVLVDSETATPDEVAKRVRVDSLPIKVGPSQFNAYWEGGITDAANAANAIGGGVVFIDEGEWLEANNPIYDHVDYIGANRGATVVKIPNSATPATGESIPHAFYTPAKGGTPTFASAMASNYDSAAHSWSIRNLTIDGNKANNSGGSSGISAYGFGFM